MEYKDLTDEQKEVYKDLLNEAAGKPDMFTEHGQPLYLDEEGGMFQYHEQVINEMINRGEISIEIEEVENIDFTEGDLVMLRLPNDLNYKGRQRHYNTWFRVKFIDNDGKFIGEVEKIDRFDFTLYKIGEHVELNPNKVRHKYTEGEQWCYGDNITICECKALCRNK